MFLRCVLLLLCVVQSACSWQNSQLKVEQGWHTQTLPNGLTYHLHPSTDEGLSVRLYVHAGSLQETAEQAGYAHFVEHMAFNRSDNYPDGNVINLFEQMGAPFGSGLNALTSYDRTIYRVDLPDNQGAEHTLQWLSGVANGLHFVPEDIEKEKGVIFGEFRESRAQQLSVNDKFYLHKIAGTPYAEHDPLGLREQVQQANASSLRQFYQEWYQPQLAELVITGNFSKEQGVAWVKQYFGDWSRGSTQLPARSFGTLQNDKDLVTAVNAGESPGLSLIFANGSNRITDASAQHAIWRQNLLNHLLQLRLDRVFSEQAQAVVSLYAVNYHVEDLSYRIVGFASEPDESANSQRLMLATLASIRDFGVTAEEHAIAMRAYHEYLTELMSGTTRMTAAELAQQKVLAIAKQQPIQASAWLKAQVDEFIATMDLQATNQHLQSSLSQRPQMLLGVTATEHVEAFAAKIPQIHQQLQQAGQPYSAAPILSLTQMPPLAGVIVEEKTLLQAPQLHYWQLGNGLEVYYLRNAAAKEEVHLQLASMGGLAALPAELFAAAELMPAVAARSGLGGLSGAEISQYLKQKNIVLQNYISPTSHGIKATVTQQHLAETLDIFARLLLAINIDSQQLETIKKEAIQQRKSYLATPSGQFSWLVSEQSYLEQSRYRFRTVNELAAVTASQLSEVHQTLFTKLRNSSLVLVGDLAAEDIAKMLKETVAGVDLETIATPTFSNQLIQPLAPRLEFALNDENTTHYNLRFVSVAPEHTAKSLLINDLVYRLATQRLIQEVRENQALDYTPQVMTFNEDGELFEQWVLATLIEPTTLAATRSAVDKVAQQMIAQLSEQEFNTVLSQLINDFQYLAHSPLQQAELLQRYKIHGYGFEEVFNMVAIARTITLAEVQARSEAIFGGQSQRQEVINSPKLAK